MVGKWSEKLATKDISKFGKGQAGTGLLELRWVPWVMYPEEGGPQLSYRKTGIFKLDPFRGDQT